MLPSTIQQLDANDELADKRNAFNLPADVIYLNGNSLGPLPASVPSRIDALIRQEWGTDLISSWNKHGWIDLPQQTGDKLARLLGAGPGQVVCCDSVSVNLFKVLTAALQLRPDRSVVLTQADNFPTDLYMAQGLQSLLESKRMHLLTVSTEKLRSALNEQIAVLYLTQVNFRSGEQHDIASLTRVANEQGALVIWDLSHSVGVMPLKLDAWQVDFAVGCGYKFLNGGPGAPAFIYANAVHHDQYQQALQGWMGHAAPFAFASEYQPAKGIAQFLTGTPNILSLAALDAALDVFVGIEPDSLHDKACQLSELFLQLVDDEPVLQELKLHSPTDSKQRGAQLAYSHPQAWAISRALNGMGVVVDYREPDLLRFGFSPLVLRFAEVWQGVQSLKKVVAEKLYTRAEYQDRLRVT